jgi:hypothetical protein
LWVVRGLIGDVDNSGVVNGADRTVIHANWGTTNCRANIDEVGTLGGADRTVVHANWGQCAP